MPYRVNSTLLYFSVESIASPQRRPERKRKLTKVKMKFFIFVYRIPPCLRTHSWSETELGFKASSTSLNILPIIYIKETHIT